MIAKGTTHNNGVRLANYLTTGKEGERAELYQLYGFAATNIKDAFRDVHIMAEATKCEHPFFHVQVRNREDETLTRQQWEKTAQRIMGINGLTGQPYAIAFHIDELTGKEHMHLAVSTIDADTLKAKPLPFFKDRLKTICRELEKEFGLEPVTNERDSPIKYAPTRAQEEQSRRLGVDIHEVRDTIRHCWDHSDNGRSFQNALEHEGLILAAGDRRGLVVIDYEGGIHALGKRILDVTPGQINARMSDLARDELPSVAEARAFAAELKAERLQPEKPTPAWDREQGTVRDEIQWQEALTKAAIGKEKIEVSRQRHNENAWPVSPPQLERKAPGQFAEAANEAGADHRTASPEIHGKPQAAEREPKDATRIMGAMPALAFNAVGKSFDTVSSIFDNLFAPKLTPQQIREGEKDKERREVEAEFTSDLADVNAQAAQQLQQESAREAARQRQRDDGRDR